MKKNLKANFQKTEIERERKIPKTRKAKNMKKLYYVATSGYDMLVSVDEENRCRYMCENNYVEFPHEDDETEQEYTKKVVEFLKSVEDDSSWDYADDFEDYNDVEDWLGIDYYKPDTPRIIAQIDTDSI